MSNPQNRRVCFVGIDGATWKIIKPMVAAGELPHLAAMMQNGSYGTLMSTDPPNSSLAWTSFQTGVHPGKHGVFFFREQRYGRYVRPIVTLHSIQAPTLWRLASDHGKRVAVLYLPMTYPPQQVNGCMVGGLLTPDRHSPFVYPTEIHDELRAAVGEVPSDNEPEVIFRTVTEASAQQALVHTTRQITQVALHAFEKNDWDLFALVYRGVDLASHRAWRYQDPDWVAKNQTASAQRGRVLADMYALLDKQLGEFRTQLDDSTTLVVCSDHGFGPITYRFFINRWLVQEGYLKLHAHKVFGMKLKLLWQIKSRGLLRRLRLLRVWDARRKPKNVEDIADSTEALFMSLVDWERTRAHSSFSGGEDIVLINLKGREPLGLVEPGEEYENLRKEIIQKLLKVEAEDGTLLVESAFRREDLWSGPSVQYAPDIQFLTHETSVQTKANPLSRVISEPALDGVSAMHRKEGVYLMEGAGVIREGQETSQAQIADMTPTIMHLIGLPFEEYMDGVLIESAFELDWLKQFPVRVNPDSQNHLLNRHEGGTLSSEQEKKLIESMRTLGYME